MKSARGLGNPPLSLFAIRSSGGGQSPASQTAEPFDYFGGAFRRQ